MGRPKGLPKYGGRQAGTPNKINNELRTRIKDFIDGTFEEAMEAWRAIDEPKDKLKAYTDLCTFVLPKLQAVQLDATVNKVSDVEDDLRKLAED